jgi:hypothetical protein
MYNLKLRAQTQERQRIRRELQLLALKYNRPRQTARRPTRLLSSQIRRKLNPRPTHRQQRRTNRQLRQILSLLLRPTSLPRPIPRLVTQANRLQRAPERTLLRRPTFPLPVINRPQ